MKENINPSLESEVSVGSQPPNQKEQEDFRSEYEKASKNDQAFSKALAGADVLMENPEDLSKPFKLFMLGVKGLLLYSKFISGLQMKYLNYKAEQKGKNLAEEFDKISKETEEKIGEYSAQLSDVNLSAERREEIKAAIEESASRLKSFMETKMVYNFSEADLQERDLFVAEQVAEKRENLLFSYPYLKALTDDEIQYLGLVEKAKNTDANSEFLKDSGISKFFGKMADTSDVDPDARLAEFLKDHKDVDKKVVWRLKHLESGFFK